MKPMDLMEALGDLPEEDIARELAYAPPRRRSISKPFLAGASAAAWFLLSKPVLAGASAAACLLLTVGAGVGVWTTLRKSAVKPPQETTTMTQTEVRTADTGALTTEQQTETSRQMSNALTDPSNTNGGLQPSSSEAALLTAYPYMAVSATPQTDVTEAETPAATTANTALSQTSAGGQKPPAAPTPQEQTTAGTTTQSGTTASEAPEQTSTAATASEHIPAIETRLTPAAATPVPPPVLKGFLVKDSRMTGTVSDEYVWRITVEPHEGDPQDFSVPYAAEGGRYQIESENETGEYRIFSVYDKQLDQYFKIQQHLRQSFCHFWLETEQVQLHPMGGSGNWNGFYTVEAPHNECKMIWDDGVYVMEVLTYDARLITEELPDGFRANRN